MIQEEQRESCVTHDHALVHTAFSFYSHQKSRIKYFLVKKKKKKFGNIAPFWNVRAEVSVEASSFRFCCAVPSRSVQGNLHRLFDLGFKSYVDSLCHSNQFLLQPFDISWLCIRFY